MILRDLKKKVDKAVNNFYANDSIFLRSEVSEWSIAHRLAVYIEEKFQGWNVDCEYNRVGTEKDIKQNSQGEYCRPDVIVHHRGMKEIDHNLLVIEVKKTNCEDDYQRLKDFTANPTEHRPYQYKYGLSICFLPTLRKRWFHGGEEVR